LLKDFNYFKKRIIQHYFMPSKNFIWVLFSICIATALFIIQSCTSASERNNSLNPKIAKLNIPPGFEVEHLYSPRENGHGSWVAITFDDKGRMIASDQFGALYRLDVPPIGSEDLKPTVEKLKVGNPEEDKLGMGFAQGLLYAFNSLYVMVNHHGRQYFDKSNGLYRIEDSNGDDQFDKVSLIRAFDGGNGEHGPHSIIMSPDKQWIYMVAGNYVDVPEMDVYRLPKAWAEDNLLPDIKDPRGHATDRLPPGGWIARTDPDGNHWELVSAGFRNAFDIAFNDAGDLFTYDSDMEWDIGAPWYRPTRICHVTSGSEFGWRTGNQKWSPEYTDNLPAILNIGPGSPTNVMFGTKTNFPEKYRQSMFAFDWSFGIIYSVFLEPSGASYTATAEEFLSGSPLPLTDGAIGPDGALYFVTGGRNLISDVYRIYYTGSENKSNVTPPTMTREHKIRRELEALHNGNPKAESLDFIWMHLSDGDRYVRYAARVALEHLPTGLWQKRALGETDDVKRIQATLALSRHAKPDLQNSILEALIASEFSQLSITEQINLVRAIEVNLFRHGMPKGEISARMAAYLNPHYPSENLNLDRLLSKVLVYIEAPGAVEKSIQLLQSASDDPEYQKSLISSSDLIFRNPEYGLDLAGMLNNVPPLQQTFLANVLSKAGSGWTDELRESYFKWFDRAFEFKGGRSYIGFVDKARKMALERVDPATFEHYNRLSGAERLSNTGNELKTSIIKPQGPGKNWSVKDALPVLENLKGRNLIKGKAMYAATQCISCHMMQGTGGIVGPDLSQLGHRFSITDILEAIIEPNKAISDQYAATIFRMKDGSSVVGKLSHEDKNSYHVSQNPFDPLSLRAIAKKDVQSRILSEISLMMPGLINPLNPEELKDLMAYLISGGNPDHEVYH
jgi:putative heme-binding domain-containing protein